MRSGGGSSRHGAFDFSLERFSRLLRRRSVVVIATMSGSFSCKPRVTRFHTTRTWPGTPRDCSARIRALERVDVVLGAAGSARSRRALRAAPAPVLGEREGNLARHRATTAMQRTRSTVRIGSGAAATASSEPAALRLVQASPAAARSGRHFSKKMSPKLGAMTQRMPKRMSAQTAPSRELPQPKFGAGDQDAALSR